MERSPIDNTDGITGRRDPRHQPLHPHLTPHSPAVSDHVRFLEQVKSFQVSEPLQVLFPPPGMPFHHVHLINSPSSFSVACFVMPSRPPQADSHKPCLELPSSHMSLQPAPPAAPDSPVPGCSSLTRLGTVGCLNE